MHFLQVILQQDYIKQDPYSGSKLFADPCCQGIDPKNEVFLDIQVIAFFEEWKIILGFDI